MRVTDPYPLPPDARAGGSLPAADDASQSGCGGCGGFLLFLSLFAVGFVGVGAFLFLRAPDSDPNTAVESPLVADVVRPEGYERLSEDEAGGGRLDETRTRIVLASPGAITGFRDAVLVSYGRPRDEPPRAVVVLAVQLASPVDAESLLRSYSAVARAPGQQAFPTQPGWVGFHEQEDGSGRYAQRVAFARGDRMYVVSVVTPKPENDTTEVLALARRQAG